MPTRGSTAFLLIVAHGPVLNRPPAKRQTVHRAEDELIARCRVSP